jgi:hypothetical protein
MREREEFLACLMSSLCFLASAAASQCRRRSFATDQRWGDVVRRTEGSRGGWMDLLT